MTTTIYRVEDRDGNGPFSSKIKEIDEMMDLLEKYDDYITYPNPFHDPEINRLPKKNEFCGFSSMEQMIYWFEEEDIKKLRDFGFRFIKITIKDSHVTYGSIQTLFKKSHIIKSEDIYFKNIKD